MAITSRAPVPDINATDSFDSVCRKLALLITRAIRRPISFEAFSTSQGRILRPLSLYLTTKVYHPCLISALMALVGYFAALEDDGLPGTNISRASACEWVALRYTAHMSDRELIDCILRDVPEPEEGANGDYRPARPPGAEESSPLLGYGSGTAARHMDEDRDFDVDGTADDERAGSDAGDSHFLDVVRGLNGLEIAAVSNAKKFLADKSIQRIITAIWDGDIIFWEDLSPTAVKHAHFYRARDSDPYARLRVPKYLKAFEVVFFIAFLALYYIVLVQKPYFTITAAEVLLYLWLASFAYNELGELWDAGSAFYLSDFWTLWDVAIVATGASFLICRVIGLSRRDKYVIDIAFDILAMEALFLVPRIFSLLSLHPYFGTLLPCLRDMTKDFVKFLSLVIILYLGFLTTFSLLARGVFTFRQMSWILIKVFFGSSYLGFDVAEQISPTLGPPLMFVFVCMTNILLITSLISILSNSLTKIIEHAADEYKFVYSVFVLEASTSNRLTYFLPPLNLIPLVLRPIRLFLTAEQVRAVRIVLLKATHVPHILAIQTYEKLRGRIAGRQAGTLPLTTTPDTRKVKAYSRGSKRFSTPQPFTAVNLKASHPLRDEDPMSEGGPDTMMEALEAIKGLEATVARLGRQVESLSRQNDRS